MAEDLTGGYKQRAKRARLLDAGPKLPSRLASFVVTNSLSLEPLVFRSTIEQGQLVVEAIFLKLYV